MKRAPKWMSEVGLEWFHRLLSEPQRLIKRYLLDDLPFFWLVLKQKFRLYKNPLSQFRQYQINMSSKKLDRSKSYILNLKSNSAKNDAR